VPTATLPAPSATPASTSASSPKASTSPAASSPGFILLDPRFRPVAFNAEAVQILSFPTKPERIKSTALFLSDKIRSSLLNGQAANGPEFVHEYKSGQRVYLCRSFRIDCKGESKMPIAGILLLERPASGVTALSELSRQFDLTTRECQTVALLLEGLTSKEIATRMKISPNTVKAFLRLVMVKMSVSTRSGIVGKIIGPVF
jgi:DNA-binding CsgD family transcriptional regulator